MDSHLVSIEVGIVSRTYQRMKLDRLTFYKDRLKCLDTKSVQCGGTVQHNRMLLDHIFKHIPYLRLKSLNHLLCIFNIMCCSVCYKFFHNKWFTKQVLTETSGLTFQHIRQRLQCSVTRSCYRTSTTAVVDQCVNSFLKHTLLVSYDNVRCSQLKESLQTVISVDDPSVQIIQVRCSETSTIKLYHRTQIRWDNRDCCKDHPLRSVAGLAECFYNFQTLYDSRTFLSCRILQSCLKFCIFLLKVDGLKKFLNGFCTHSYTECISSIFFFCFLVFCFRKHLLVGKICLAFVKYDIRSEIQDSLQSSRRDIKDQTHTARDALEIPDMRYRCRQSDMTHTLTADTCLCYLNTTAVAHDSFITDLFVLSTVALPVFTWSEDSLTEKSVFFRFQCSVVDCLRLRNLTF